MEKSFDTILKLVGVFLLALIVGGAFFHKNLQSTMADLFSTATLTEEEREVLKDPAAAHKAAYDKIAREFQERSASQRQTYENQSWKPPVVDTRFQSRPQTPYNWNWKK